MQLELKDLRLFLLIAQTGSLTRASEQSHLSLAATSARIKALEEQAGMPLLIREARGVRLSPPGEAFLHHARAMLEQTRQLQADLQEYGAGLRGHVRVFANTTAVTEFMPDILAAYLMQHPHISVDLQERPNAHIAHDIREGRADLGIIAGEVDTHGLTSLHFSTDRLVLVTPDTPAWRSHQQIAFAQVLHEHFVGMHRHSTLQTFLDQIGQQLGHTLRLRIQLSNFDAMCRMVAAGVGVAVVPESAALRHRSQSPLHRVQLQDAWAVRPRYMLLREGQTPSPHVQALMDAIQAYHLPQHAPQAVGAAAG
ncbi:LysR substrate-binding domain-containing protein [Comamonas terrigena]|uniref:LysR substrate-binding domain-containing protein n=1 Tax=Comamonas terrigena TaxID=32013 RepID=UPI0024483B40|nr:LysR substrate-binding domain-containing protein [Comamonas terrigena]MDH0050618.1 LysR substrate-binding domain-containing protein [Comamonas terrigena]MDH0513046.1 LysR substrate-binding domain-containing protein [Comamonas terrigena]MDH1092477.1 LysR substrate-binding domain-containing protein [Comamonas terrigena]MDH1502574.1 LysR substrate-binding domain-containing protein [Comamonas terrigena]